MTNKPEPNFAELAAMALGNTGIDPDDRLQCTQDVVANAAPAADAQLPAITEADDKEVIYEITFNLPDVGLGDHVVPLDTPIPTNTPADIPVHVDVAAAIVADINPGEEG
jgi:hypothetical protein